MTVTLEQLKAGDRAAWKELDDQFQELVLRVLCRDGCPESDAEDIYIEVINTLVHKYLDSVCSINELRKLLVRMALNKLADARRRHFATIRGGGKVGSLEDCSESELPASSLPDPEQIVAEAELFSQVRAAMQFIPKKYRDILTDLYWLGLTQQAIAGKYGLSIGSIGVYKTRGLMALGKMLKKEDFL